MALIQCPECGREKVSDTAEMCPDCGFGIKEYYVKIKEEETQKLKKEEISKLIENQQKEYEQNLLLRSQDVHVPLVKPFINLYILTGLGFSIAGIFFITEQITDIMIYILSFGTAILFFSLGVCKLKEKWEIYDKYKNDETRYKKEIIALYDREQAESEFVKQFWKNQKHINTPTCPNCGNTNVQRISTINRAVDVSLVDLASSKIGKQYQCPSCNHKW